MTNVHNDDYRVYRIFTRGTATADYIASALQLASHVWESLEQNGCDVRLLRNFSWGAVEEALDRESFQNFCRSLEEGGVEDFCLFARTAGDERAPAFPLRLWVGFDMPNLYGQELYGSFRSGKAPDAKRLRPLVKVELAFHRAAFPLLVSPAGHLELVSRFAEVFVESRAMYGYVTDTSSPLALYEFRSEFELERNLSLIVSKHYDHTAAGVFRGNFLNAEHLNLVDLTPGMVRSVAGISAQEVGDSALYLEFDPLPETQGDTPAAQLAGKLLALVPPAEEKHLYCASTGNVMVISAEHLRKLGGVGTLRDHSGPGTWRVLWNGDATWVQTRDDIRNHEGCGPFLFWPIGPIRMDSIGSLPDIDGHGCTWIYGATEPIRCGFELRDPGVAVGGGDAAGFTVVYCGKPSKKLVGGVTGAVHRWLEAMQDRERIRGLPEVAVRQDGLGWQLPRGTFDQEDVLVLCRFIEQAVAALRGWVWLVTATLDEAERMEYRETRPGQWFGI